MANRDYPLAEFNQGPPPTNEQLQVLAEDSNGTYLLPFRCVWRDGAWYAAEKTKPLEATVVGWRPWRYGPRRANIRENDDHEILEPILAA